MSDTAIIIQLRETINRTENMVPFMRLDMLDLLVSVQSEIETLTDKLKQMQEERDEVRRMYCSVVESSARQYGRSAQSIATQLCWNCYERKETL